MNHAAAPQIELSVVVITKNEEVDLPGFLRNFLPIADEVVVIDDGSTDGTEAIAAAAGPKVRFIRSPRRADEGFCDQRQKGVEAARGNWLLQVDCDMRMSPELALEVRHAVTHATCDAFRFRLKQYWMNRAVRYGGFQYRNDPWFTKKTAIRAWIQKVHERIEFQSDAPDIQQFNGRMHHLIDIDFAERLRKNHQYSTLEAERLLASGERFQTHKLVLIPFWRFFRSYILMFGFLDGRLGFTWSFYQFYSNAMIYFVGWSRVRGGTRQEVEASIEAAMATESALERGYVGKSA